MATAALAEVRLTKANAPAEWGESLWVGPFVWDSREAAGVDVDLLAFADAYGGLAPLPRAALDSAC